MSRLWQPLQVRYNRWVESFSHLSEKDLYWYGRKNRAETDVTQFPSSCFRMVCLCAVVPLIVPICILSGIASLAYAIYLTAFLPPHPITILISIIAIFIGLATFSTCVALSSGFVKLMKGYFFLLSTRENNIPNHFCQHKYPTRNYKRPSIFNDKVKVR